MQNHHHQKEMEPNELLIGKGQPIIIAMKGHPGTGKSTLARGIASALKFPLLDKDDIRDTTMTLQRVPGELLNDLSYQVLWRMASTQVGLGLSIVVDSPLSRRSYLERLLEVASSRAGCQLFVVECKPGDEDEWRRRLEKRGDDGEAAWHKPVTWTDMERLLERYEGCFDYDVGDVPKLVLDTTAKDVEIAELVSSVLAFIASYRGRSIKTT